ncbi:hypothetical protein H072_6412 [Dactylellina haptotyla CBS 200.50]|uniref:Apple domain-containing protein n=1 Tax=Dactylellina haptotyla (strain CBS 200.50) TaxID=1284197 RepID=S8AAC8_DACHA|nr:hypothetical protein H072_6412 [Dactylellina haptotyla CBS 200.50]
MKLPNLFRVLLFTTYSIPGVFAWYNQQAVKTLQTCKTEYCKQPVHNIPRYTRTIHTTSKVTVTITPNPTTYYVTKKHETKTIIKQFTKTYYTTAKCSTYTFYVTRYVTSVRTIWNIKTITSSVNVTTITPDATTVPAPSGFISAGDDPDNQSTLPEKRDNRVYGYPTAVKCTKTIETIIKSTTTAKRSKITITKYGKSVTISRTRKTTKTHYPHVLKTTTLTRTSTRTTTTTKKSTRTITKSLTAILPGFTTINACGPHNIFPGSTGRVNITITPSDIIVPVGIAYECCAACHTHVNAKGVPDCAGSFYKIIGVLNPKATCYLRLTDVCSYDHHESFMLLPRDLSEIYGFVSNGLCGRWKLSL